MDIDFKNIKLNNGKTIEQMLKQEAHRFVDILQEELDKWYASYNPIVYQRTFRLKNSLTVSDYIKVNTNKHTLSIDVFMNENAYSNGMWGQSHVNLLMLLNDGYQVKKNVWFKNIKNFGYRDGGHFIEKAIARFEHDNELGIKIKIYKGGR